MKAQIICHVIDYGASTRGSFIPALCTLASAVRKSGNRFVVIATKVPNETWRAELEAAGADVQFVERRDEEVIRHLRALKPDIVHSHFTRYDFATLRGWRNSRVFWHVHSSRTSRKNHRLILEASGFLKNRLLGRGVEHVAVSQQIARETVDSYAPRDRVHVVYNGIDTTYFHIPSYQEREQARAAFGFVPSDRVALFFDRVPLKGGTVLKQAMALLPQYRLLVVGGSKEDCEKFHDLPNAITLERVSDTRKLYWAADVLAFGSTGEEAFGFVLVEALACGVPIAASNIAVVKEICGDVESVVRFPVGNVRECALAIESAFGREISHGRERIQAHFNLENWTKKMMKLYGISSGVSVY